MAKWFRVYYDPLQFFLIRTVMLNQLQLLLEVLLSISMRSLPNKNNLMFYGCIATKPKKYCIFNG